MKTPVLESKGLVSAILDALTSHICVLDRLGTVRHVNRAWRQFALENASGPTRTGVGTHYLQVCRASSGPGSEEAAQFAKGVEAVLHGQSDLFQLEYPCHSPNEDRWFVGRVTPLKTKQKGAVVSHMNVTDRKRVEQELAKLAETDPLTGLPNRRFFMETAGREIERLRRFSVPTSIVMVDLDHFKNINDKYGHAAGDDALRSFAASCKNGLRKIDVVARIGGEEFVILLPGTTEQAARGVAEKLRKDLERTSISSGNNKFRVTASFGVTEASPDDLGIDALFLRADSALYAAKRSGRNRVATYLVAAG